MQPSVEVVAEKTSNWRQAALKGRGFSRAVSFLRTYGTAEKLCPYELPMPGISRKLENCE
jgi:hypothetical protein